MSGIPDDVRPGAMLAGKYRVVSEIGRGGFGVVLRAVHVELDKVVAIKLLVPGEGGEAEWREDAARFRREGQATAALRSDYVVRILDVDVLESGVPYIVMEHLEGETLHYLLHARAPLPVDESVDCVVQVLAALAEAHAAGIVHRDLKPANVFVARGAGGARVVKVLDFGVSKVGATTHSVAGRDPLTRTGAVLGTVAYMAPEQMLDAKRVDGRADIWSVGVILHEVLTRKLPFGAVNAPTLVTAMLTQSPARVRSVRPDVPEGLEAVILRCLAKDPSARYATAAELGEALVPFATRASRGALETLRRAPPPKGAAAPDVAARAERVRRSRGAWSRAVRIGLSALALALVVTAGAAIASYFATRSRLPAPAAPP